MTDFVSLYCERRGAGFWAEPLNALSNLAFALAAVAALLLWLRRARGDTPLALLIATVALIAIGSFLFHTMPGPLTVLLDVVPIQLFVIGYLALALRRFLRWPCFGVIAGLAVLLAVSILLPRAVPPGLLSGSLAYAPAFVALLLIGALLMAKTRKAFRLRVGDATADLTALECDGRTAILLLSGAALFAVSLTARTLDRPLCGVLPAGLHFLWHLMNGALLFLLLMAAIEQRAALRRS